MYPCLFHIPDSSYRSGWWQVLFSCLPPPLIQFVPSKTRPVAECCPLLEYKFNAWFHCREQGVSLVLHTFQGVTCTLQRTLLTAPVLTGGIGAPLIWNLYSCSVRTYLSKQTPYPNQNHKLFQNLVKPVSEMDLWSTPSQLTVCELKFLCVGSEPADGQMGWFLHDVAQLTSESQLTISFHSAGFHKHYLPAEGRPSQAHCHTRQGQPLRHLAKRSKRCCWWMADKDKNNIILTAPTEWFLISIISGHFTAGHNYMLIASYSHKEQGSRACKTFAPLKMLLFRGKATVVKTWLR